MLHFVFPASPLDERTIDEDFAAQRQGLADAGFSTSLVADATFREYGPPLRNVSADATVVYRGWMVEPAVYDHLTAAVRSANAQPLTTTAAYTLTHHLPHWYALLRDLTPETHIFPEHVELEAELRQLGWSAFFIKDYVKSLKTAGGSFITDPSEASRVLADMRQFRGVIEGGICVRRVESFRANSERRYFVLNSQAFAPSSSDLPEIIQEVTRRIPAPFFSVDIAENERGVLRVVEVGDGQVSDLVGWSLDDFVRMWQMAG